MSDWHDFVTNAVFGIERGTPLDLPEEVAARLDPNLLARLDRNARFLTRAGAFAAFRRLQWRPSPVSPATPLPAPAADEESPSTMMSALSGSHLRTMLGGRHAVVLPEWLDEAARLQRLALPELVPALLNYAGEHRASRGLALAVGGRRAAWLAEQNPAWNFGADIHLEDWERGPLEARLALFQDWREEDPAGAREKLAAIWKSIDPESRAALLGALEIHLSDKDTAFLEAALDDRAKEVRRIAAHLLLFLATSPLVTRMTKRADALLKFQPGNLLRRTVISVALPDETDQNGIRDGLDTRAFGLQIKLTARAILLIQILGAVPLEHWTEGHKMSPLNLLKAVAKDPQARVVATGWAMSAMREHNADWAESLLDGPVRRYPKCFPAIL